MRGTTRKRLSVNQWKTFISKNSIQYHQLWQNYEARKLRNEIAYQGHTYNSLEFYWNSFVTRNIPHFKSADDNQPRRVFRSTADVARGRYRVDPDHPDLLHTISYPLYEVDKELSGCKRRFDNSPKNITTFLRPYSYKFYAHQSNYPSLVVKQSTTVQSTIHPYADVFSASNGMDLMVTNCESDLVHRSVPYDLRQKIFKPAVNNVIMQIQLIHIARKSTAALNECLHSAHERNVNAMVRYAKCDDWAGRQYAHTNMHMQICIPGPSVHNESSTFLDLHHSLPVSSEIFYRNPTITHIRRKKFLIRSLIKNPSSTLLCAYCNKTLSCEQCVKCELCDFHFFNCRHMTNLNLIKKERNQPLALKDLAAVVCRRKVSVEAEKAFPNREDIKKSSMGQCPMYQNGEVTFLPTPQQVVNYVEFFAFQQPEWSDLLVRFRLETNIEKVEQRARLQKLLSQPRHTMLFETTCPMQQKSQTHLDERAAYLNVPMNIRVMTTQWNGYHSFGSIPSSDSLQRMKNMFMDGMTRSEGRNSNLVPTWVYSDKPIPGYYHVDQIVGRFESKLLSVIGRHYTREEWFDLFGRNYNVNFSTPQLTQNEYGDWVQMIPPPLLTSIRATSCLNLSLASARVASKILYLNDRESDTPSPSFFDEPSSSSSSDCTPSSQMSPLPAALVPPLSSDSQMSVDNGDNDDQNSLSDISDSVFLDDDDDDYYG